MSKALTVTLLVVSSLTLRSAATDTAAADTWFEIKSPNFTVWADANDGNTRTLMWQLEQVRSAVKSFWPWARVELGRPLHVFAVKHEQAMKNLLPWYWDVKGGVRPASVWSEGPDGNYIAIRTDLSTRDEELVNPHQSAFFSYINLILNSSFDRDLPLWYSRGVAGVMSNTMVRNDDMLIGATIPWHLEQLQNRAIPIRQIVTVTRASRQVTQHEALRLFDAQSWAFVHYLLFAEGGQQRPKLDAFIREIESGAGPDAAFTRAIGNPEEFERAVAVYTGRRLFQAAKVKVDAQVKRERFAARPLSAGDTAAGQAALLLAMGRQTETAARIAAARKADPNNALAYVAEAMLFDRDGRTDEAKSGYAKAIELGAPSAYAHYRAAVLNFPAADPPALGTMEKQLARAVELNPSLGVAHAALAEVRAMLQRPQAQIVPHLTRALQLEPASPWARLSAARVLWRLGTPADARKAAEAALALADDPRAKAEAERLLQVIKTP